MKCLGILIAGKSAAGAETRKYSEPSGDEIVCLIMLPRKTSKARFKQSVPEIDTDRRGEHPKALG